MEEMEDQQSGLQNDMEMETSLKDCVLVPEAQGLKTRASVSTSQNDVGRALVLSTVLLRLLHTVF